MIAGVLAFEAHKDNLLAVLLKEWERGPKSQPFDEEKTWHRLSRVAWQYFWRKRGEIKKRDPREIAVSGCRKIATVLTKASRFSMTLSRTRSLMNYTRHGVI